jgi:hypothetical protein
LLNFEQLMAGCDDVTVRMMVDSGVLSPRHAHSRTASGLRALTEKWDTRVCVEIARYRCYVAVSRPEDILNLASLLRAPHWTVLGARASLETRQLAVSA